MQDSRKCNGRRGKKKTTGDVGRERAEAPAEDGGREAEIRRRAGEGTGKGGRGAILRLRDEEVIGDAAMNRVLSDLDLEDLRTADVGAV